MTRDGFLSCHVIPKHSTKTFLKIPSDIIKRQNLIFSMVSGSFDMWDTENTCEYLKIVIRSTDMNENIQTLLGFDESHLQAKSCDSHILCLFKLTFYLFESKILT